MKTKIYTKKGDRGETSLFGGDRVSKADLRIEAYGTVDELCAHLGFAVSINKEKPAGQVAQQLNVIQNELFVIGSHLATPYDVDDVPSHLPEFSPISTERLEKEIDAMEGSLPGLRNFIIPGGTKTAAELQIARTVCRRAERSVVRLMQEQEILPEIEKYLNRLSDYLFVLARFVNHSTGLAETTWNGRG